MKVVRMCKHQLLSVVNKTRLKRSHALLQRVSSGVLKNTIFFDEKTCSVTFEWLPNIRSNLVLAMTLFARLLEYFLAKWKKLWPLWWCRLQSPRLVGLPSLHDGGSHYQPDCLPEGHLGLLPEPLGQWLFRQWTMDVTEILSSISWNQDLSGQVLGALPRLHLANKWSPSSQDLDSAEFTIWSLLETNFFPKPHHRVEPFKQNLAKEWKCIPHELQWLFEESIWHHLRHCIQTKGYVFKQS